MTLSYLFLNLIFISGIGLFLLIFFNQKPRKIIWYTLVLLLVITALFDSIFIILGIFEYEPEKILGLYIWKAPVEDFLYTVASVAMVGLLWEHFESRKHDEA